MGAKDSWTKRRMPAAAAAAASAAEPSRRTWSFSRQAQGSSMRSGGVGMWVARLTTTSACAAARAPARAAASNGSTATARAPCASSRARFSALRPTAVTRWPSAARRGTSLRPMAPVAPLMKMEVVGVSRFISGISLVVFEKEDGGGCHL